jgi:predicted transposase YbfD/YdcC
MVEDILLILSRVEDPRDANARHDLGEVLFLSLCGLLCGETTCSGIADFASGHEDDLRDVLTLRHGVPSHDTLSRVLRHLDPAALDQAFTACLAAMSGHLRPPRGPRVLAVDGKALRGAYETGRSYMPPLMVSVFDAQTRLCLAQTRAGAGGEAAAARALLAPLRAKGAVVTGDALHCRPDTAQVIRAAGADYVLMIKGNQPELLAGAQAAFARAKNPLLWTSEEEAGHGRRESRAAAVVRAPPGLRERLPGLVALGRVTGVREQGGRESREERYVALSRLMSAGELARSVRLHWSIENGLHWTLDVVFDEDRARTRKNYGPENWAVLRRLARNILEVCPEPVSIRRKMKRASWSKEFCFGLFAHMR